jgi:hypothetical protein
MTNDIPPGHRCRYRELEWLCAGILLLMAAGMSAFDAGIATTSFRRMLETGITQQHVHIFVLLVGPMRVAALVANGEWPRYGPAARALGALLGAVFWGQLATALVGFGQFSGAVTMGVYVYIGLACGELLSVHRALADARFHAAR